MKLNKLLIKKTINLKRRKLKEFTLYQYIDYQEKAGIFFVETEKPETQKVTKSRDPWFQSYCYKLRHFNLYQKMR